MSRFSGKATIDLHTHSSCSDGLFPPEELVARAVEQGLTVLALTDHDTVAGVARALEAGEKKGCEIVPGIEVSCFFNEISCHLLGYYVNHASQTLALGLDRLQQRRRTRNQLMIARLQDLGIPITYEELLSAGGEGETGRPHMAGLLVDKGVVSSHQQAFSRFLGKDGPAYVPRGRFEMTDAVTMIRDAGGVAVLAHPGLAPAIMKDVRSFLRNLQEIGVQGVEVFYPAHTRSAVSSLLAVASELGLARTGGSDYHGSMGRDAGLGCGALGKSVPLACLDELKKISMAGPKLRHC